MNKTLFFSILAVVTLLQACTPKIYYQVYTTQTASKTGKSTNPLQYEDNNCLISYNLWANGGSPSFRFYNKTDKPIFLHLSETFFINNELARNYFQNRTYSVITGSSTSIIKSHGYTASNTGYNYLNIFSALSESASHAEQTSSKSEYRTSYKEDSLIAIPPHTHKPISDFSIVNELHRDCKLIRYPNKKDIETENFSKEESPYTFTNIISYSVGKTGKREQVENTFYVSDITNYPEKEFMENIYPEFCGQKSYTLTKVFKKTAPNQFYLRYNKGEEITKH